MNDSIVLGIDGGGSTCRVIVTTPELHILAESETRTSVNPNGVGRDVAMQRIHETIQTALQQASLTSDQISAVGIGIAGAEAGHSAEWLREVVEGISPGAKMALSSDHEIALVGAHGRRLGVLILSGTGSIAYGVNSTGKTSLIGGWGYLLGDEGSGYWVGMEGLKAAIRAMEGRDPATALTSVILQDNQLQTRGDIIHWVYGEPRVRDIARFAPLVLEQAEAGDRVAFGIVEAAAHELERKVCTILHQLDREPLEIAFTGSLLSHPNPLSRLLCELLGLSELPQAKYPAVMGAALLALELV
ncbi:MAG: BadF/BadG/BcrA/BcrD ATPase family protein [bacterium]|nr:BadF/BadG/BcrA/BcrD ATPase family protein [bacterium]